MVYIVGGHYDTYNPTFAPGADDNASGTVAAMEMARLNGSDSWEFYLRGFPVTYSEELVFSPVYHQTNDSTTYMNMRYCTSIIKAGMGMLATMANYPQKVENLFAKDMGNGNQLVLTWTPNTATNITGYKIGWGGVPVPTIISARPATLHMLLII